MSYEMTGVLKSVSDTQVKTEKLTIKEFALEVSREWNGSVYKDIVGFQAKNKNIDSLNDKRVGDTVKVKFDIQGREHQGRVYNSLNAFGVYKENGAQVAAGVEDDGSALPF